MNKRTWQVNTATQRAIVHEQQLLQALVETGAITTRTANVVQSTAECYLGEHKAQYLHRALEHLLRVAGVRRVDLEQHVERRIVLGGEDA